MFPHYLHLHTYDKDIWHQDLGAALVVLLESSRRSISVASALAYLLPYARLSQLAILYGRNRHPAAYLAWGNLTLDGLNTLIQDPNRVPDPEMLNAGDHLVVLDIVSNLPNIRMIGRTIAGIAGPSRRTFYAVRHEKTSNLYKLSRFSFTEGHGDRIIWRVSHSR